MTAGEPRITVQICTFNRAEPLRRCLRAVGRLDFPPAELEVVVVDDGSDDPTPAVLDACAPELPFSLRVVRQGHRGLAAARNAGIRAACGDVVLFIDDDTVPHPKLAAEHWRSHDGACRLVVLGRVRHFSTTDAPRRLPRLANLSTSFFWTTNVSARRRDLVEAGLFDEAFSEYGWEDVELGDRLRALGLRRRVNWRAIVDHEQLHPAGADLRGRLSRSAASGRSAVVYLRKHPTRRARLATGLTSLRRSAARLFGSCEPWLWTVVTRTGDRRLGPAGRAAEFTLCLIHYYRAAEEALGAGSATPTGTRA